MSTNKGDTNMRVLTTAELNDPTFFDKPEYDAEKIASYNRALDFCNKITANARMKNDRRK